MSEVWLRLGIVGIAVLIALVTVLALRRRRGPSSRIEARSLPPGVYLFSSSTCVDCIPARNRLQEVLGASGFVEIEWEQEPELFDGLGIDVVPSTVVVSEDGTAARFPGMPDRALEGP